MHHEELAMQTRRMAARMLQDPPKAPKVGKTIAEQGNYSTYFWGPGTVWRCFGFRGFAQMTGLALSGVSVLKVISGVGVNC